MSTSSARVVLISAIASGQGKTTVTAALARKLRKLGQRVRVFKTGPDFIDPMMLERASGVPVLSLDLWMVGLEASRALLAQAAAEADVILIEGVMGLYDGNPSSADLAQAFGVPVLAVVDASAMAQTVGAIVMGLRDFGPVRMAGVIANRIASPGHAQMVADAMHKVPVNPIPLLASLPRQEQGLPERHLGLVLPDEVAQLEQMLDLQSDQLALDLDAWNALPLTQFECGHMAETAHEKTPALLQGKTIAIARDAAFAFIYPANVLCLQALGAKIEFFSPLADQPVPAGADAVYLPGGYPELHAGVLSQAQQWQASIRAAHARGLPILAECGGMMVLTDKLVDQQERTWTMAGLLPGRVVMQKRLAALGAQAWSGSAGELRGHTFHYSRFETSLTPYSHARKHAPPSANPEQGEAIYRDGNLHASYFHAYFPSNPLAVAGLFSGETR
ncbi:cobyrinate a,c-diamide synthase [Undibacterium sp. Jales W-56]|uniref:cobyrinate a,c-diamide synthase n=1 Tax=Undibacterium sp. Jales W-56 TaxID=2897325 RepID=UPI0021CF927E|nr:cobyrinate a,c-diamide synthase [Undibacterium sp. Jales W-56]MCU6433022.1 cobyrinate a,c-diamide synthase [Undibacterium sp. Jales W-56]